MEDAYQYHEVNSEQPEQSQNNDEPPKKKSKIKKILTIAYIVLSVLAIGGMSSNISSLESANNKLENENTDLEIQVDSLKELKDKNAELKKQTYIFRKNRTKSEQKTIKRRFPINWKPLYISNKNTPIYLNLTVAIDQLSGHENRTRRNPSPYFLRFT